MDTTDNSYKTWIRDMSRLKTREMSIKTWKMRLLSAHGIEKQFGCKERHEFHGTNLPI